MAEKSTLVERMAEARQRKADERREREGAAYVQTQPFVATQPFAPTQPGFDDGAPMPPARPSPSAPHRPGYNPARPAQPAAAPVVARTPARSGGPAVGARPPAAPAHGKAWQLTAQRGEALMLLPGQMHFGAQASSLRTLLGSCVAITLWHPAKRLGGMCHYLLPSRTRKAGDELDGRYGDEAVEAMLRQIKLSGTAPGDYVAHLYGGADTMPEGTPLKFNVGERNIEFGWSLIDRHGFQLEGVDVGEDVPRTVTLTLATGEVLMKRGAGRAPATEFGELI
jgi:chemotaxis protein CheD